MPLSTSGNASFLINQTKSITLWSGGDMENEQTKLKYIVRDLELDSWGEVGIAMDLPEGIGAFSNQYGASADILCKRVSDTKIFVAVRPMAGYTQKPIYYSFGTLNGTSVTFTPYKVLQNSESSAGADYRSLSALVVPDEIEPVVFFGYCDGPGFFIIKITESGDDSVVDLVSSSAYPYYTRLIKKNNLVIASYAKSYQSSQTFSGIKPAVRAYNYNPVGKTLAPVNGGSYEVNVPILSSNLPTTNLDIFFTGEGYNFMIVGPDFSQNAVPV